MKEKFIQFKNVFIVWLEDLYMHKAYSPEAVCWVKSYFLFFYFRLFQSRFKALIYNKCAAFSANNHLHFADTEKNVMRCKKTKW